MGLRRKLRKIWANGELQQLGLAQKWGSVLPHGNSWKPQVMLGCDAVHSQSKGLHRSQGRKAPRSREGVTPTKGREISPPTRTLNPSVAAQLQGFPNSQAVTTSANPRHIWQRKRKPIAGWQVPGTSLAHLPRNGPRLAMVPWKCACNLTPRPAPHKHLLHNRSCSLPCRQMEQRGRGRAPRFPQYGRYMPAGLAGEGDMGLGF